MADKPILDLWDQDEAVRFATNADHASDDWLNGEDYWTHELGMQSDVYEYFMGELREGAGWRSIAAMQSIDPHLEPTRYWGDIEPNLRALDIWIGSEADRGRGHGEGLMRLAIERSFASPEVTAIIIDPINANTRAHAFYQRTGFVPTHRQIFNNGEDDCLIHRLTRSDWEARCDNT
jgi:aminoglycoside 6'-N-acetyltransferase